MPVGWFVPGPDGVGWEAVVRGVVPEESASPWLWQLVQATNGTRTVPATRARASAVTRGGGHGSRRWNEGGSETIVAI